MANAGTDRALRAGPDARARPARATTMPASNAGRQHVGQAHRLRRPGLGADRDAPDPRHRPHADDPGVEHDAGDEQPSGGPQDDTHRARDLQPRDRRRRTCRAATTRRSGSPLTAKWMNAAPTESAARNQRRYRPTVRSFVVMETPPIPTRKDSQSVQVARTQFATDVTFRQVIPRDQPPGGSGILR